MDVRRALRQDRVVVAQRAVDLDDPPERETPSRGRQPVVGRPERGQAHPGRIGLCRPRRESDRLAERRLRAFPHGNAPDRCAPRERPADARVRPALRVGEARQGNTRRQRLRQRGDGHWARRARERRVSGIGDPGRRRRTDEDGPSRPHLDAPAPSRGEVEARDVRVDPVAATAVALGGPRHLLVRAIGIEGGDDAAGSARDVACEADSEVQAEAPRGRRRARRQAGRRCARRRRHREEDRHQVDVGGPPLQPFAGHLEIERWPDRSSIRRSSSTGRARRRAGRSGPGSSPSYATSLQRDQTP